MKKLLYSIVLGIILSFIGQVSYAQKVSKLSETELALHNMQGKIYGWMTEWKVPGCAISIVKDGQVLWSVGLGQKNTTTKQTVTPQTLFPIASCSKSFTAAAMAILVDEGKVDWNKPVKYYLPDFELNDTEAEHTVMVKDLLSHRTGLPRHDFVWLYSSLDRKAIFKSLKYLTLSKKPYEQYQYNNLMYMVAGVLIERVSGMTWEKFVEERLLKPLKMNQTVLTYPELFKSTDYAKSYRKQEEQLVEAGFGSNVDAIGPAGAVKSNAEDMSHWLLMQLQQGKYESQQIISSKSLKENHIPLTVVYPTEAKYPELGFTTYGMGWNQNVYRGAQRLQHNGSIEGFRSQMTLFPNNNIGIFITTNSSAADYYFVNVVTNSLTDMLFNLPEIDWNGRMKQEKADVVFAEEKKMKEQNANRILFASMSHNIDNYTGIYEHPAYGILQIYKSDKGLMAKYHNQTIELVHFHYDYFLGKDMLDNMPIQFMTNFKGAIDQVQIDFPNAGIIQFLKKQ
ncbi:serine hydrolase [Flectobacillus sp. BAB-3569]|uniref:serine hydrolase n=1 Tax=Flectobacillus sp. BAB-3569 TaxID=1509483 RepID=UPI000BA4C9D4|nr:serine hydrolase [Flectobacillus sp. BAB-3569]PAC31961.1 hypothetical protein BWI92_06270 [Flectobacillus sp. BAB-3569]